MEQAARVSSSPSTVPVVTSQALRRRVRMLFSIALILGFFAVVALSLFFLIKREPSFYVQAEMTADSQRRALSQAANIKFLSFRDNFLDEAQWGKSFTAEEINAFFQDDFLRLGGDENLPEDLHNPRVKFEDGRMRLGIRYGSGFWSTILSIEIKMWLVPGQINTIALEIVSLRGGALPLSTATLLDYISQLARRHQCDIAWYRNDGHPTAIIRYQADVARPTLQIEKLEFAEGEMTLVGRATDALLALPESKKPQ
jgi:hypothetical protein